jgi:hypothetical protein
VDDGLPLHAAASSARAAVAMMAAAVRAVGGRARHGRRMTRLLWFIMPSLGLLVPAAAPAGTAGSAGIGFMPAVLRPGG